MKRNPQFEQVRARMAPGQLALDGFLGDDDRNLDQIISEDGAVLEAAGVEREEVGAMLDELHEAADAALESPRSLYGGAVTVQLTEVMGRIPCPFGCGTRAHKACIQVVFGGRELTITPLHAHLVRDHGFFQGRGSVFRLEPADAITLCRLRRQAVGDA